MGAADQQHATRSEVLEDRHRGAQAVEDAFLGADPRGDRNAGEVNDVIPIARQIAQRRRVIEIAANDAPRPGGAWVRANEGGHIAAAFDERAHEVPPDEAGRAGDEHSPAADPALARALRVAQARGPFDPRAAR